MPRVSRVPQVHGLLARRKLSLKSASSLRKTAQTWRGNPANCSDLTQYSGKLFRLGEKIRLHEGARKTIRHHPGFKVTSRKLCLKCAKNLYLRHRFFDEIRQIHRFFEAFRQKLQILLRNQARNEHIARNPISPQCPHTKIPTSRHLLAGGYIFNALKVEAAT